MAPLPSHLRADVARIGRISAVPDVLAIVARLTGMRFVAVARVTDTHWVTCQVHDTLGFGLKPGDELALEATLCNELRCHGRSIAFGYASKDPMFGKHHLPRQYGFESYVSVPIRLQDNTLFGTLCALDPQPVPMEPPLVEKIELLAQLVGAQIQSELRAEQSESESRLVRSELGKIGASAQLRNEFISILGHDLRNPLQSVRAVVDTLAIDPSQLQASSIQALRRSLQRMEELIAFACDFAHGTDSDWLQLNYGNGADLIDALTQVIDETCAAYPSQVLSAHIAIDEPVHGDSMRLAQVFGSMMINAVVQGLRNSLIKATATTRNGQLRIEVRNLDGIDPGRLEVLQASTHAHADSKPTGDVNLGLHMAAQIVRAHQGELHITSGEDGTYFTVEMACRRPRQRMRLVDNFSAGSEQSPAQ